MTSLFTVVSYELAQQVLTDNVRFSSAGYARTMGEGWARGPWARAGQGATSGLISHPSLSASGRDSVPRIPVLNE